MSNANRNNAFIGAVFGILLSGCGGTDLAPRNLLVLTAADGAVYAINADGSGRVTLMTQAESFHWDSAKSEIEVVGRSKREDLPLSPRSVYRFPYHDAAAFYRVSGTNGAPMPVTDWPRTASAPGVRFSLATDTLTISLPDGTANRIADVRAFALIAPAQ